MEERVLNNSGKFFNNNGNNNSTNFAQPRNPQTVEVPVDSVTTVAAPETSGGNKLLNAKNLSIAGIAALVIGGTWYYFKKRKQKKAKEEGNVIIPEEVKE